MKLLKSVACLLALALSVPAAAAQLAAGKDYQLVNPPQPTSSGAKIEVIEFFYYGCPGCAGLQGPLKEWLKRKPADVDFKREPVVFRDAWLPLTTAYHAMDAMGVVDKLHADFFKAIHDQHAISEKGLLKDQAPIFDWVAKQGVDRKKFMEVYNSFGVRSRTNRSIELPRRYDIGSTPSVVVDGKYLTAPSMAGSYPRFFEILDDVIARARQERAAKTKK